MDVSAVGECPLPVAAAAAAESGGAVVGAGEADADPVDEGAEWLGRAMTRVCDAAMPRSSPSLRRSAYWWSDEIADLRRTTVAA